MRWDVRATRVAGAALRVSLLSSTLLAGGVTQATGREATFRGELNYETLSKHAAEGRAVRVTYSPGGAGAAGMQLAKVRRLVIDGPCHSACAWAFVQNENACFTRRAVFGFHGAADPGTGRPMPAATQYWLSHTRPSLRARIDGVTRSLALVYVTSAEMARHYPERACEQAPMVAEARRSENPRDPFANARTTRDVGKRNAGTRGGELVLAPLRLPSLADLDAALRAAEPSTSFELAEGLPPLAVLALFGGSPIGDPAGASGQDSSICDLAISQGEGALQLLALTQALPNSAAGDRLWQPRGWAEAMLSATDFDRAVAR
jgi:hypothetical protein